MKAIITGGAGFIGSNIAEKLVDLGWQIKIIDDLSSGEKRNIEHLQNAKSVDFIQESVLNLSLMQKLFAGFDYVFHLAAIPNVSLSILNPISVHNTNATGTLNVLIAARDNGIKKVVLASSSAVYGDIPSFRAKEDMLPNPQSPYAASKLAAEYYCQAFNFVFKLPTICLRYFNVYGPRQNPNSEYSAVIPKFIKEVIEEKPITIFGDGEQSRDFVFVRDVVTANIKAAESNISGTFNIGTGVQTTLNQLIKVIVNIMKKNIIEVEYLSSRPGDIRHSLADITKARDFGYIPQYALEQGLVELIKDQKYK
jgi:UDP-glucose 4-epimerase